MKRIIISLLLVGVAILLTACQTEAAPAPLEVTIEMSEYKFAPEKLDLKVGQKVTITLVNVGQLEHEFMIGRNVIKDDEGRPYGYEVDFFEAAGITPEVETSSDSIMVMIGGEMVGGEEHMDEGEHMDEEEHMDEGEHTHGGFMVLVPVGSDTATITFTVTEDMVGEWEMGCFELDGVHYDSGMKGTVTVTN